MLTGLNGNPAISIASTGAAFAALHADGALTVWGDAISGGDEEQPTAGVKAELGAAGVEAVYATKYAFAAKLLGGEGGVLAWGDPMAGGDLPLSTKQAIIDAGGVTQVASTTPGLQHRHAQLTWLARSLLASLLASLRPCLAAWPLTSRLPSLQVASTTQAFAVLASDGSIHAWGDKNFGGTTVEVDTILAEGPKAVALYSTQVTPGHRLPTQRECVGAAASCMHGLRA